MIWSRACERVDRLRGVSDDAEVVAAAEPEVEESLLQRVDVALGVFGYVAAGVKTALRSAVPGTSG